MADLKFTADYSDLSKTVDVLVKIGKASDDTAKAFGQAARQIVSWQQKFATEQGRVNAALETNHQKQTLSNKSAKESASIFMEQARAAEANAQAFKNLKMSYDAEYAAEQRRLRLKEVLRKEIANGNLTLREAGAELLRYRKAVAEYTSQTSMRLNQVGVGIQQVGYQVGDFLVQVQSGTSAFVAFGQQATQLVGILPMFADKLGMTAVQAMSLSAGLGIAIPLVTALGAAYFKANKSTKTAAENLEDLVGLYDKIESTTFETHLNKISAVEAAWSETLKLAREYDQLDLQRTGVQARRDLLGDLAPNTALGQIQEIQDAAIAGNRGYTAAEQKLLDELLPLQRQYNALRQEALKLDFSSRDALQQSYEAMLRNVGGVESLTEEQRKALKEFADAAGIIDGIKDSIEGMSEAQQNVFEWATEFNMAYEEHLDNLRAARNQESAMAEASAQFLENEREAQLLQLELTDLIEDAYKNYLDLSKLNVADGIRDAAEVALLLAERLGISEAAAREMVNIATNQVTTASDNNGPSLYGSNGKLVLPSDVLGGGTGRRGSGGKTPAQLLEEYMSKVENEAELKRSQVGLSEEAARVLELENQYKLRGVEVDNERIASIVAMEEETRKLTEAQKAAERQQEFYKDTLMDGMESIVDGSKSVNEAFRDMLRNMLLDIYRQKVMEPIAQAGSNFLMNLLPFAKGGAFNNGVQMFANGGVVSSPTMFGHSGGLGMMGEAGPEAIMPLKRGPDGKLGVAGSQGNVVVNQSFNFSANGDDSVKRIIAQAAPQIAQMTQKQIMDSRRRGGQMKSVFS